MKKIITILSLSLSMSGAFAHGYTDGQLAVMLSFGTTVAPFQVTVGSTQMTAVGTYGSTNSTSASIQARGVAGKEQLLDELVALNDDMIAGRVSTLEEVRQPALKELLSEIRADKLASSEIHELVKSDSELADLAIGVSAYLLNQ